MDNTSSAAAWVSVAVSVGALIVAIWAIVSARIANRRSYHVQERLLRIENTRERDRQAAAARAALVSFIVPSGSCHRLYIRNEGNAVARAIHVALNGEPLRQSNLLARGEQPPTVLAQAAEASVLLLTVESTPRRHTVSLTWEDDSSLPGDWTSDLSLG